MSTFFLQGFFPDNGSQESDKVGAPAHYPV